MKAYSTFKLLNKESWKLRNTSKIVEITNFSLKQSQEDGRQNIPWLPLPSVTTKLEQLNNKIKIKNQQNQIYERYIFYLKGLMIHRSKIGDRNLSMIKPEPSEAQPNYDWRFP